MILILTEKVLKENFPLLSFILQHFDF